MQATKDFLFIVLALGFAVITFFLSIALYSLTQVLRNARKVTEDVAKRWPAWGESVDMISQGMKSIGQIVTPITNLAALVHKYVNSKKNKK